MIRALALRSLAILFLTLAAPAPAYADVIRGRVLDPQDRPVARATVLVVRTGTVIVTTVTNADGQFGPLTVPAGEYDVLVSAPGLEAPPERVSVAASGAVDVSLKLSIAARRESVVVSASQVERPLSRVTDSVTVIDRADLEARQSETASDALRMAPGFSLISGGFRGAITSLFPRGGESDYTLVLVDGIALNAFGGGFDAAHLATAGIDRIEIVRGPQSALFGSGAIGGIVHVVTRKGGPPRVGASAEVGQQGTTRLWTDTSGAHGAWSWGAAFERFASDGDTSFRESIGARVTNDDYQRANGSAGLGWSDSPARRIRVDVHAGRNERGHPGPYGSDPFDLYSQIETSRGVNKPRGLAASGVFGDARSLRHAFQFGWSDTPSEFTTVFGTSENRTRRRSGRYQADVERGRAGFSAGAEVIKERADNTFVTGTEFQPIPVERVLTGLFAESRWDAGPRLAVTAGLRAERIERAALGADAFGSRPPLPEDVVWSVNPKISAAWFIRGDRSSTASTGWTKIRGGAGTGIKPPTVFELGFTDNPSLRPERSRSADFGIEHAFPRVALVADATAFVNRYDDLIVAVGLSLRQSSPFQTDNVANARAGGVEFGLRWQSPRGLSVRGAYTYLRTRVLTVDDLPGAAPAPYAVGDWLIRRPRHTFSIDTRFERGALQVFAVVQGRSRMLDVEPNIGAPTMFVPGHATVTAGASYRLARSLQAYARVINLFDRDYEDALGYPAQARSATVGLRVAVGR